MSIKSSYTLTISLSAITILSGIVLSSTAFADSNIAQDNVSVNVPVSCTMNGTGMTSHTANIPNGTYESEIGTTTLKSFCNDSQGFAIYAIGYTNEEYGNTTLIGASGGQTIVTGTATTTGNPDVSNWAVKLATDSTATYPLTLDNSFNAYSDIPSTYTKVAHRDSGTDLGSSATGAELTTTYAAYISKGQKADTYNGKVKFTLVHPSSEEPAQPHIATSGCINYFANASTAVGQMGCQTIFSSATYATLWASNFKRDGYGFAGWSDQYNYATNSNANFYGPNQDITFTAGQYTGNNNGLSLYAVWIKSAGSLQDSNKVTSLCGTGGTGGSLTQAPTPTNGTATLTSVTALTDERDGNTYAIAKLADGKCWTIENLRLADKDASNNDINLTSANTHNPSLPLNNSWYYKNQQGTLTTSNHLSATSDPTSTNPDTAWCQTDSSDCDDQSMLSTNHTTLFTNNTASSYKASSNVYSYGNYYNWYSATAGHGKYGSSYGSNYTAPGDICPAGWHLPTGKNATGEFGLLDIALGGTGASSSSSTTPTGATMSGLWRSYPNNFVYSGYVRDSSVYARNSDGYYWSASGNSSNYAHYLLFYSTSVSPGTGRYVKFLGKMVRCLIGS